MKKFQRILLANKAIDIQLQLSYISIACDVLSLYYNAEDKDNGIIDLVLVRNIDQYHLNDLSRTIERYIKRKISSLVLISGAFNAFILEPKAERTFWRDSGRGTNNNPNCSS